MKRVIIESPYAGTNRQVLKNRDYARACMRDSLSRGEAPFASHLLYPLVLDDRKRDERFTGIHAGFVWGEYADLIAVYMDNGMSPGMEEAVKHYRTMKIPIEIRSLVNDPLIV